MADQNDQTSTPPAGGPRFDPARALVLIVDDNPQNAELLQAYLSELRCRTAVASDGERALALFGEQTPDLVLLDIMMPRMSGFQVCETIRKTEGDSQTPIIMVTALNQVADVERSLEAGADDFLTKPVDRMELNVRVQSQLRIAFLRKQLDAARAEVQRLRDGKE